MFYYTPTFIYDSTCAEIANAEDAYAKGDVIAAAIHLLNIEKLLEIYVKF